MKRHQHKRPPVPFDWRRTGVRVRPGANGRNIIAKVTHEGREYVLHATKGYRATRA
jgi:hypothetical protein